MEAGVDGGEFEALVLLYCTDMKNSALGCNYLEHIEKENNGRLSNDVLSLCLKMLTTLNHSEPEILRMANRMMNSGEPLGEDHLPSLIETLSTTPEWRKGLELMKKYKPLKAKSTVPQAVLEKLCLAGLRNGGLSEVQTAAMETQCNQTQFDSRVMNACLEEKNVAWARAYFDLVERQQKRECSIFMLTQYLSILELSEECVDEEILAIVARLTAMKPIPAEVVRTIISALCATGEWGRAVPMLQYFKDRDGALRVPKIVAKKLCMACIRHGRLDEAWQYLDMFFEAASLTGQRRHNLNDVINVFIEYARTLESEDAQEAAMVILFTKLGELQAFPDMETKDRIAKYAQDLGWQVSDVFFPNKRTKCFQCNTELRVTRLPEKDFQELQEYLFANLITESNIFLNTSPEEWSAFTKVVEAKGPFTHIIDGLNIGFASRHKGKRREAQRLTMVLGQISAIYPSSNVLVIGSKHMLDWAGIEQVKRRAILWLLDNESKDDLFFIYAAMKSGQEAKIVTRDQMRNHAFQMERKFRDDFRLWQQQAQIKVFDDPRKGQDSRIAEPAAFTHACQGSEGVYHLPYDNGKLAYDWQLPNSWLCLVKEGRKKKQYRFDSLRG